MNERLMDCSTMTVHPPGLRAAIVAVEDEERARRALYACLQRPGLERVILRVQLERKGGTSMSESLMDCSIGSDHTPAEQPTILLVEDEERVRLALHSFLQRRGYEVISVGTVEDAEQCIREGGSENISVVVSDINLQPESEEHEGYEFCQRLATEHPDLPFVLISGDHDSRNLPAVRSGAVRFLAKPFDVYDLLAAVRSALRR